jgi:pimeloyl-ACP methyl ester carboxylesterase
MTPSIGYFDSGRGTPVIALHSSMSSKLQWTRLAQRLERDYQFIAIDLAGYGQTAFPANPAQFSLQDEIGIVSQVIRKTIGDHVPFHLIGHSYGGATALRLAHEQPHRILSLSLYEPTMFCLLDEGGPQHAEICRVIDAVVRQSAGSADAASRIFIDYWNGEGAFDALPEDRRAAVVKRVGKISLDFQALINDPLAIQDCKRMDFPVCLMSGRSSPKPVRRIADLLQAALPNVFRHDFDAGHMGPVTHADKVGDVVSAFLDPERWQPMQLAVGA